MFSNLRLIFMFVFLVTSGIVKGKNRVFIKYSINECVVCYLPLSRILNDTGKNLKEVVFPTRVRKDKRVLDITKSFNTENIRFHYSDSLYYLMDSTNNSLVYILNDKGIVYCERLKEINITDIRKILNSNGIKSGYSIDFRNVVVKKSGAYLNLFDKNDFNVYRVPVNNLTQVFDTIKLNSYDILQQAFKSHFQKDYKHRLDTVLRYSKRFRGAVDPMVSNVYFDNDTIKAIFTFKSRNQLPDSLGEKNYSWDAYASFMRYIPGKYLAFKPIMNSMVVRNAENYIFRMTSFFEYNNNMYADIYKDTLTEFNFAFAKAMEQNDKIELGEILPIQIPTFNVESKLSYLFVNTIIQSGPVLSYKFVNEVYNLNTLQKMEWPFFLQPNNFQKRDVNNLVNKSVSGIIDMHYSEDADISVVYFSNDTLFYAQCFLQNNQLKLLDKRIAMFPFSKGSTSCVADNKGLYIYDNDLMSFVYRRSFLLPKVEQLN